MTPLFSLPSAARFGLLLVPSVLTLACANLDIEPAATVIHARFDPDESVIPMPSNVLRDAQLGHLDLPLDDESLTAAERELYAFLNTLDGWSSASAATVEFTAALAPATANDDTV